MLQILIGGLSGIFSGIGMGGGTILIFLLTTFAGLEQHIAQATNLIYFIPTAISAIIVNYKNKNISNLYFRLRYYRSYNWFYNFCKYTSGNFKKIIWNIFDFYCNS